MITPDNKDLALQLQRIEDKLNLVAEYFHIGQPMKSLTDIERKADAVVRRVNFNNKKKKGGSRA